MAPFSLACGLAPQAVSLLSLSCKKTSTKDIGPVNVASNAVSELHFTSCSRREVRREPGNGLILGGSRLCSDIRDLEVSTHRESMARLLVNTKFALVGFWKGCHYCLDLLGLLKRDLVIILCARKRHWTLNLFHIRGELKEAWMACEAGIDERLAIDFGAVGKRDRVFAAPAEAGRADG
ncbi:hypothetical protein J3458_021501 [Metarhizium acridum]|uniref:uncharacterized protein n=1 Tax=Metarhizium acridum TaxID=92637 RepID=UPI001C6AD0E9|nr:hypothetical protein J3458_021501 [Metarhizium acridum]